MTAHRQHSRSYHRFRPAAPAILAALVVIASVLALVAPGLLHATPAVSGSATSSVVPCLQVGSGYLSTPNPYVYEQDVFLYWTGTITSAQLVGYQFNAGGDYGRTIKINGVKIGSAAKDFDADPQCRGFENGQPQQSWPLSDLSILKQGRNTLRIEVDPAIADQTWGISRAQIEVTGSDVDGRHYKQVTIPSTYYNNWSGSNPYANEGTWTHIMEPQGYDPSKPTPLLISAHGFGSLAWDSMQDYHDAAASRGWLLASADFHGEVWNEFMVTESGTGVPVPGVGRRTMGSRASQWDILDIMNYMQAHYNVDPTRIYLVGHSMGGMTALLAGARYADKFAAVVSDSAPTNLAAWEDETELDPVQGATPNASINHAIRVETGTYVEPTHYPGQQRQGPDYPFEYQRRSPIEWAANYQHLPLWILHPGGDQKVLPHHAEDMFVHAQEFSPDRVERTYFPGVHGDRINGADFANTQLDWLSQFTRPVNAAPQPLNFNLDSSGSHFWIGASFSTASLNEAHWLQVRNARYDQRLQTIDADVENTRPMSGDPNGLGVAAPKNMPVTLTFDVARVGLPASGTYTVERVGKDDGSFSQTFVTATAGKVQVSVPQGAHIVRISAGGVPPNTKTLALRQGTNGYTGAGDTYISTWAPDKNYGTSTTLSLRVNGTDPIHTGLLRFDLSQLPSGATVRFAVLSLRVTVLPNAELPLEVDKINRGWKTNEATWNRADAVTPWTSAGANDIPGDRAGHPTDARTVYPVINQQGATVSDWYGLDVSTIVQGWVADPSSNQGVALRVDLPEGAWGGAKDGFSIAAADYPASSSTWRPQLTLIYTQDPLTPTPSNTPTATATPTNTATPTMTPTATATPRDGSIRGFVFMDSNRNGARDVGESGVGRLLQLKQTGVVQANVTSGADGSYAFDPVQPGVWEVVVSTGAGYQITSASGNPATAVVQSGAVTTIDFGLAPGGTPGPTPTMTRTPCPSCVQTYLPLILNGQ